MACARQVPANLELRQVIPFLPLLPAAYFGCFRRGMLSTASNGRLCESGRHQISEQREAFRVIKKEEITLFPCMSVEWTLLAERQATHNLMSVGKEEDLKEPLKSTLEEEKTAFEVQSIHSLFLKRHNNLTTLTKA